MRRILTLLGILVLVVVAGCGSDPKPNPAPTPAPDLTSALVGAWIKPEQLTHVGRLAAVDGLERDLGRRLPILNTYRRFDQMVGTRSDQEFLAQGATLMVSWATGDNRSIVAGTHDALIKKQARAIRAIGKPVLLRMRWEMDRPNLQAEMWSGADYIAAWKHVRAIFKQQRATNVSWVFCPTAEGFVRGNAPAFYPGDDQVDWTCVDVYAGGVYQPIGQLMGPFLQWAAQHPKPIIIGEFGVAKAWGSTARAAWLSDAARTFKANTQIKAIAYFESDPAGNGPKQQFQLTGDLPAFKAFEGMVKDKYFNPQ